MSMKDYARKIRNRRILYVLTLGVLVIIDRWRFRRSMLQVRSDSRHARAAARSHHARAG